MVKLREVLNRQMNTRGESIKAVADACHMPTATLHGWLQGTLPSAKNVHHLKALSEHFGISVTELLFNSKDGSPETSVLFCSEFVDAESKYRLTIEKIQR